MFDAKPLPNKPYPGHPDWGRSDEILAHKPEPPPLPFEAASAQAPAEQPVSLEFTGTLRDYFAIWAVTQLLTLCTLGLYGPWSRTRRSAYLAQHWRLDGVGFECRYQPVQMLKGRLLVFVVLVLATVLMWWQPLLSGASIVLAFAFAPKLLANSFAFRWRTLRHRGVGFSASTDASALKKPFLYLGIALALAAVPQSFWFNTLGQSLWLLALLPLIILPAVHFWPKATSVLTHHRFSAAAYGDTKFELAATAQEIYKNMWKNAFDGWFFLLTALGILIVVAALFIENKDIAAFISGLSYLALTVYGVTFARGRRINFVLHRLSLGGLRFTSTLHANKAGAYTAGYAVLAVLTLGLSLPWSTIHYNRWRAAHIQPYLDGDWWQFSAATEAAHPSKKSGAWDEMANAFDIEIGL